MRKFLVKTSLFIFTGSFCILVIFVGLSYTTKYIASNFDIDREATNIIIGDSRTEAFLDDLIDNSKNISLGSESFYFSYHKLKYLIDKNKHIKTLFIGASYHSFSDYYDDYIFNPVVMGRYFFLLPIDQQLFLLKNEKVNVFQVVKESVKMGFLNVFKNEKSFIGKSYVHNTILETSEESIDERISKVYLEGSQVRGVSTINLEYFVKIVKLCRDNNINIEVLNTPTHTYHEYNIPAEFKEAYNSLMKSEGLFVLNFTDLLKDDMYLPDGDHVNLDGAKVLSIALNQHLKN